MAITIIKRFFLVLFFAVAMLLLLPVLFKGKLEAIARAEFRKLSGITVDFDKLSVNAFRNFPNLAVTLYAVTASDAAQQDFPPLADIQQLRAALDIRSLFKKSMPLTFTALQATGADIQIHIRPDSSSNISFLFAERPLQQQQASPPSGKGLQMKLEAIRVTDLNLSYLDDPAGIRFVVKDLDFSGKGLYREAQLFMETSTTVGATSITSGGISYLNDAVLSMDMGIDYNTSEQQLQIGESSRFTVNDLVLLGSGILALRDSSIYTDLMLQTEESRFKSMLSLVPNAYTADFQNVDADGSFVLHATLKGDYNQVQIPSFSVSAEIREGRFRYPDFPLGVEAIAGNLQIHQPGDRLEMMDIRLSPLRFSLDGQPFEMMLELSELSSIPWVKLAAMGSLDLNKLHRAFPFPDTDSLSGLIRSNLQFEGRSNDPTGSKTAGNMEALDIRYKGNDLPLVQIGRAQLNFDQHNLSVIVADGTVGRSDFAFNLRLEELLSWLFLDKNLAVSLGATSRQMDFNEWIPTEAAATAENSAPLTLPSAFDKINFDLQGQVGKIIYGSDTILDNQIKAQTDLNQVTIQQLSGKKGSSDWLLKGQLNAIRGYLLSGDTLSGTLDFSASGLKVADFMAIDPTEDATAVATASETIAIPGQLRLLIRARIQQLQYGDLSMANIQSILRIGDRMVELEDCTAQALGGQIHFSGSYSTPLDQKPSFRFYYELQSLDFQQSFAGLNTFRILMPIGKYISGKYSSNLFLEGDLGDNLVPDYRTLRGRGYLETSNAIATDLPVLQTIGQQLQIKELQQPLSLGSSKNWFDLEEGYVTVPPFELKAGKLGLTLSGKHGIDQQIDYRVQTAVPLDKISELSQQIQLPKGLQSLKELALGKTQSEKELVADVDIHLTGLVNKPKSALSVQGVRAGKPGSSRPDQVEEITGGLDLAINQQVDTLKGKIEKEIAAGIDTLLKQNLPVNRDSLQKSVDQIKKQLEELNPFKKKKKSNER